MHKLKKNENEIAELNLIEVTDQNRKELGLENIDFENMLEELNEDESTLEKRESAICFAPYKFYGEAVFLLKVPISGPQLMFKVQARGVNHRKVFGRLLLVDPFGNIALTSPEFRPGEELHVTCKKGYKTFVQFRSVIGTPTKVEVFAKLIN